MIRSFSSLPSKTKRENAKYACLMRETEKNFSWIPGFVSSFIFFLAYLLERFASPEPGNPSKFGKRGMPHFSLDRGERASLYSYSIH
jgi:hypothetical protein